MFRIQTEMKRYETCIALSFLNFGEINNRADLATKIQCKLNADRLRG